MLCCAACDCYYNGTLDGVCVPSDNSKCPCKYNFAGKYCRECVPGFYNFPKCDGKCEPVGVWHVAIDFPVPYICYGFRYAGLTRASQVLLPEGVCCVDKYFLGWSFASQTTV